MARELTGRRIAGAVAMLVLPWLLAAVALVLGVLLADLALVYASIALSVLGLPLGVVAVVQLVRG